MDLDEHIASISRQLDEFTHRVRRAISDPTQSNMLLSSSHQKIMADLENRSTELIPGSREALLKNVKEVQRAIEKENIVLVSSLKAIEAMVHDQTQDTVTSENPPLRNVELYLPEVMRMTEEYRTLSLLYAAYGIDDVESKGTKIHSSPPASPMSPRPQQHIPITRTFYNPQKLFKNEGVQTEPEYLLPLDIHDPIENYVSDRSVWVKKKMIKGTANEQPITSTFSVINQTKSREHINKPYRPVDWEHVYDQCPDERTAGAHSCGSLRAACDGNFTYRSLAQWITKPLTGATLHSIEPITLRNTILTECDPTSPNKIRLSLPMTHISGNAYAMGIIVVRDHDILLFREGAEDKKTMRMPYRTIASIRLGSTPQSVDRTVPPPLTFAIPPSATQFFLMNKIQFSDTYRQFYRTAVIQPMDVGDGQGIPSPSSIIFDTETDCHAFLSIVDIILQGSGRTNSFAPLSGVSVPLPKSYLGLDFLTMTGRSPVSSILSVAEVGKRQLAFAKNAALSDLDVFPTHDPLSMAESEFCASQHIPPRVLSEIKSRLLSDPSVTWISALDVATLCTAVNSKTINLRQTRLVLEFLISQNKIEAVEIIETMPSQ